MIDRLNGESLVQQLTTGFRRAIYSGMYKIGSALPSLRVIARELGVSLIVPRAAMAALEEDNLVVAQQGVGYIVRARESISWNGRVLLVLNAEGEASFYWATLAGELRRRLTAGGWLVSYAAVSGNNFRRHERRSLEPVLMERFDLALVLVDAPGLVRRFVRSGQPFVTIGKAFSEGAAGSVPTDAAAAVAKFVDRCVKVGIRSVEQVDFEDDDGWGTRAMLQRADIEVKTVVTPVLRGHGSLDGIQRGAMKTFLERFSVGRPLPDLFLFTDDFVAAGALTAAFASGIRIPEDVQVATVTNRGAGPVFTRSLARLEMDPLADAARVADASLLFLGGKPFPSICLSPSYVHGETMRG